MDEITQLHSNAGTLFERVPAFKQWIEETNLFDAIVRGTHQLDVIGITDYRIIADEIQLSLAHGVVINKAEDLPKEILYQFYIHSPFCQEINNHLNLITNGDTD